MTTLRQFGKVLVNLKVENKNTVNRDIVVLFIDSCKGLGGQSINRKLTNLKELFDWLELETSTLIRRRDYQKCARPLKEVSQSLSTVYPEQDLVSTNLTLAALAQTNSQRSLNF